MKKKRRMNKIKKQTKPGSILLKWTFQGRFYEATETHQTVKAAKEHFKKFNAGKLLKVVRSTRKPGYYKQIYNC